MYTRIAVFRAFAQIVENAENQVVVIDTAPTGHTLLLPRLRNPQKTEVIIDTLAEATPVYEAMRLEDDLKRAGIATKWWVINSSMYRTGTTNRLLSAKASNEIEWINKVDQHSDGNFAVIDWSADEIKGEKLLAL